MGTCSSRIRDTWRLKVYVGHSADGRKRYVERTVHGTRREAERDLARLVVEVDEGRHVASAPMTVGELLDRWLDIKAQLEGSPRHRQPTPSSTTTSRCAR